MKSYFSVTKNIMERFFFIFGKTNDSFCDDSLVEVNLEFALNRHLKAEGYKRVIFYSKTQKIHCYDTDSYDLVKNLKKRDAPEKQKPMVLKGPLSSGLADSNPDTDPKPTVSNPPVDTLHFGKMSELDAFNRIDFCMKDRDIKTAVIFTNADDFIQYFGGGDIRSKVYDSFNQYDGLSYANSNIMLFIFPQGNLCDTRAMYSRSGGTVWATFFEPRIQNATIIQIDSPSAGEIRNAISYARFMYDLRIDFSQFDEVTRKIARVYCAEQLSLNQLLMELKILSDKNGLLNNESCDALFKKQSRENAFEQLNKLIGMESVKKEINILSGRAKKTVIGGAPDEFKSRLLPPVVRAPHNFNLHYVLTGNPGTGKTTTARLLGEVYYELGYLESGHTVKVTRNDLVAGYVGQTAIKTSEQIERAMGGVLFIDEAYTLSPSDGGNDFGQEAIDTLLEAMSDRNGRFAVIAAGYPKEMDRFINSNPGLQRRFSKVIHIDDYTPDELMQIFNLNIKRNKYTISDEFANILPGFFDNWFRTRDENWGNAGNVERLIEHMYGNWSTRDGNVTEENEPVLDIYDVPENLKAHCKPISEVKKDAVDRLNNLVGLGAVKEKIHGLRRRIRFSGKSPEPGHYVFAGDPGTGKTTAARLLGDIFCEIGVLRRGHVIEVSREDLVGQYVGETAIKTKRQLEKAMDGILFIDEAYRLYEPGGSHNYGKESIDTILAFMENHRHRISIICAGYTNQMEKFIQSNEGLRSRFNDTIIFEDYNTEELLQILTLFNSGKGFIQEEAYIENSRGIFDYWVTNKGSDFGNARDVRNYARDCEDMLYRRLDSEYPEFEDIPVNAKKTLTGVDIPNKYLHILKLFKEGESVCWE